MNDTQSLIGKIISGEQERDAIHVAVAPVVAGEYLRPGDHVSLERGLAHQAGRQIGIVDPFLTIPVTEGQTFWLFLYPNTITSLRHNWTHPTFERQVVGAARSASEAWMRAWAVEHTPGNYYDEEEKPVDEEVAYAFAINAGHENYIGPYESARDFIDNEWWAHWEAITGERGSRGEYFSCSC